MAPDAADISAVAPSIWRSLAATRLIAGTLLALMALLYVIAVRQQDGNAAWGYVRAFAEAALVGGLADWFAVTAIFRRPLGLPIPHTAVIPHSKARIADALGQFVAVNFLSAEIVGERLRQQDLAHGLGKQLSDPSAAHRIASAVMDTVPALADLLEDEVVGAFMRRQIGDLSRDQRLAALIGRAIRLLTEHGRHQVLLDAALEEGWRALAENEQAIRAQVRSRTSWVWRLISLDARASDALISSLESSLREIAEQPQHPLRHRVTDMLNKISDDLQNSPEMQARIEAFVMELLAHPAVTRYFQDLWQAMRIALRKAAAQPRARDALGDAIAHFGEALLSDPTLIDVLNVRLRALLTEVSARHGSDVGTLISETIRSWDTKTVVEKLEQNVGPDLQYIRINGTLIGGLVGLAIHQTTAWLT